MTRRANASNAAETRRHRLAAPLDRSSLALNPAQPRNDQKGLAERMCVPSGACARLESHHGAADMRGLGRLEKWIDPHGAGELLSASLAGRLGAVSLDFHAHWPSPRVLRTTVLVNELAPHLRVISRWCSKCKTLLRKD
jgi:hypothetical protein